MAGQLGTASQGRGRALLPRALCVSAPRLLPPLASPRPFLLLSPSLFLGSSLQLPLLRNRSLGLSSRWCFDVSCCSLAAQAVFPLYLSRWPPARGLHRTQDSTELLGRKAPKSRPHPSAARFCHSVEPSAKNSFSGSDLLFCWQPATGGLWGPGTEPSGGAGVGGRG